jgi:hypothetical protein
MTKENRNQPTPAYEARLNHIRLTIWENVNKGSSYFNTVITRSHLRLSYFNTLLTRSCTEVDEWKESCTCRGRGDLALVAEAVSLAREFVRERTLKSSESNNDGEN